MMGIGTHCHLHCLDITPYTRGILCQGLKRKEVEETIVPEVKTSMMYASIIGVGLLDEMANVKDKVDHLVLKHAGREVGQGTNIHHTQQMVAVCDTRIDGVKERMGQDQELVQTLLLLRDQLENQCADSISATVHMLKYCICNIPHDPSYHHKPSFPSDVHHDHPATSYDPASTPHPHYPLLSITIYSMIFTPHLLPPVYLSPSPPT